MNYRDWTLISATTCNKPTIENGLVAPSNDTVDYDETYTVTCDTGYTVDNSILTCGADGTLDVDATCTGT